MPLTKANELGDGVNVRFRVLLTGTINSLIKDFDLEAFTVKSALKFFKRVKPLTVTEKKELAASKPDSYRVG